MHRRMAVAAVLLFVAAAVPAAAAAQSSTDCSYPVERTDATGEQVRVDTEPDRVVTLNPSAAQTMREIGAWDKVVGATKHASNLDGFEDVENISGAGRTINNEEVVGLEPDLVLAPNTIQNETVLKLRDAGLTVYRFRETRSIPDIEDKVRLIGNLVRECAGADDTVDWMHQRLAVVEQATANTDRPTAMYVFFGYTAGNNTFIHRLIERAGADNAAATAGIAGYKQVNEEILLSQNPDWLVLNTDSTTVPKSPAYNGTTALRENQIIVVNTNHLNRPAPRVVYAVEAMAEAFHPDAHAAANATQTPDQSTVSTTVEPTETPTAEEPTATTTPGSDGPGFGPVLAVVALLAVAVWRAR